MGRHWDVIVVGAGPAGCAAAAAVLRDRPGARVLIVDRSEFPRDKVCGDAMPGAVIGVLEQLAIDARRVLVEAEPLNDFQVRAPGGQRVARVMAESVYVIPRLTFDQRLLEAVLDRGAEFAQHRVRQVSERDDAVVLDDELTAEVVIGADGAESTVRRSLGVRPNSPSSTAIALRGYGPELPGQNGAQLITMARRHWPAYAWSFPLGNGRANLGYGQLLSTGPTSRGHLLASLHRLLPGAEPDPRTLRAHRLPMSTHRPSVDTGRVLLAGDAQSLVNPLTGEGIYYAMLSGMLAGTAAAHADQAGRLYRHALTARLGRYLRHATVLARLSGRPALMDAILRGAARSQPVFDDLVRIGLTDGTLSYRLLSAVIQPRNWISRSGAVSPT